ncbi:unnamed protein product [Angiostrongylus costaricensis]|uniref:Uncharacterized protein n=1 Tax=Angiostrongylus costaricensis TaxID=334426 RepID=A0A0R3PPW4_ANGCS|nr:unnamed protein product [Angiostrongylus costaricensis]
MAELSGSISSIGGGASAFLPYQSISYNQPLPYYSNQHPPPPPPPQPPPLTRRQEQPLLNVKKYRMAFMGISPAFMDIVVFELLHDPLHSSLSNYSMH